MCRSAQGKSSRLFKIRCVEFRCKPGNGGQGWSGSSRRASGNQRERLRAHRAKSEGIILRATAGWRRRRERRLPPVPSMPAASESIWPSTTVISASRTPLAVGVKATSIVQVAPAFSIVGHRLLTLKSDALKIEESPGAAARLTATLLTALAEVFVKRKAWVGVDPPTSALQKVKTGPSGQPADPTGDVSLMLLAVPAASTAPSGALWITAKAA